MKVLVEARVRLPKGFPAKIRKISESALRGLGYGDCELSILITGNDGIRALNKEYRKIDKATDVLSFPMEDTEMLGDIVISYEKTLSQAKEFGVTVDEELGRLLVHGLLHLLGYDHVKGGRQAQLMRKKEGEVLGILKEKKLV
ncbi:MAG: rRNA maturation RNase YbeY [Deltaproteobacteria bacterium GWC2_56_8]|nr:MAG: rRNA maturation RNase YbeY [Deltaproteobacteria bacterium GWB2_55_19]OGP35449.1 MAG: rRNA maturation RNase YbeY [Deltaproteobacteria bacterium GWC2_56_8]